MVDKRKIGKHGFYYHRLYGVWRSIKDRVYNPNHEAYGYYGGDGVIMCDEWKNSPKSFIEWALANGWKIGLHIDKDKIPFELGIPAKIYSPEMCSILTSKENNKYTKNNTWFEFHGKKMILNDWAKELNIDQATLHHRIFDFGYTIEEAFTLPVGHTKNILIDHIGMSKTLNQWSEYTGIKRSTLSERLRRGWSIEDALTKIANKK